MDQPDTEVPRATYICSAVIMRGDKVAVMLQPEVKQAGPSSMGNNGCMEFEYPIAQAKRFVVGARFALVMEYL